MALTATAQSALLPTLSWDETIVPALRKRLESESRALARRISAASITSLEDSATPDLHKSPSSTSSFRNQYSISPQNGSAYSPRPSGIPRPSLGGGRPSMSDLPMPPTGSRGVNGVASKQPTTRPRTVSQPRSIDREPLSAKKTPPLPAADTRSVSPVTSRSDIKPTRIPVARTRTFSMSSHGQPYTPSRSESRGNGQFGAADPSPDLDAVTEYHEPAARAQHNHSPQPEPFSMAAHGRENLVDDFPTRASTDSEERPFEHWYRGEVSRNGGVGELRVGKRMEMLEIANYGHTMRARAAVTSAATEWSRNGSRRRAGSIGANARESFYMEEDELGLGERVLDEAPLTDLEADPDTDQETTFPTYVGQGPYDMPPRSASAMGIGDERSVAPNGFSRERASSRATQKDLPPSRIPTPSFNRASEPPRTPTPTHALAGSTSTVRTQESPKTAASRSPANSNRVPRSQSSPIRQASTAKRRAKSPAETTASAKKAKARTPPATHQKRRREDEDRRSIAEYPDPGDGDMANAIPTWTQPVPPGGNWDDVVLPVVARKKGLDEYYTKADGSPKPRKKRESIAPAPGTFGYDYSKYRPGHYPESIPMDEFGRPDTISEAEQENTRPSTQRQPQPLDAQDAMRIRPPAPASPAPFSHYMQTSETTSSGGGMIPSDTQTSMELKLAQQQEEETSAGCCKCIVM